MTILLALLFPIAIQYERGGWWNVVLPVTLLTIFVDVVANWTELSLLLLEWPKAHEYTFSDRLERLVFDGGWRGELARPIAMTLNRIAPSHSHIKSIASP